nr:hypothetical protein Q903MT_gene3071 [Picea sitchensis]
MLDIFVGGLWEDIKHVVCIQRPSFLSEAIRLAREIEAYNFASRRTTLTFGLTYKEPAQVGLLDNFVMHLFVLQPSKWKKKN